MLDVAGGLLGQRNVFWPLRDKLYRPRGGHENAHQAWLHRADRVAHFCGHNLAAPVFVANINLAVVVALRLDAVFADFAFNEVNGLADRVLHDAFDFTAIFWLWLHFYVLT